MNSLQNRFNVSLHACNERSYTSSITYTLQSGFDLDIILLSKMNGADIIWHAQASSFGLTGNNSTAEKDEKRSRSKSTSSQRKGRSMSHSRSSSLEGPRIPLADVEKDLLGLRAQIMGRSSPNTPIESDGTDSG